MKTAESTIRLLILLTLVLFPIILKASMNISFDVDARYNISEKQHHAIELYEMGTSVRKIFADQRGDRVILLGLLEAERDFSEVSVHEIYGRYKGPLAKWNITAGRFTLPYGLLNNFRTSRLLYHSVYDHTIGMDVDNGVMISGHRGSLDYAVSVTQGYGAHRLPGLFGHGFVVSRLGWVLGEIEEVIVGISGAYGKTSGMNEKQCIVPRAIGGGDATLYIGRLLARIELNAGEIDKQPIAAGFLAFDYSVFPKVDANVAISQSRHENKENDCLYAGFSFQTRFATFRGGYRHGYISTRNHEVVFQCYRLFSSFL